jgi:hypothetical protein
LIWDALEGRERKWFEDGVGKEKVRQLSSNSQKRNPRVERDNAREALRAPKVNIAPPSSPSFTLSQWVRNLRALLGFGQEGMWRRLDPKNDPYASFFPTSAKGNLRLALLEEIVGLSSMQLGSDSIPLIGRRRALYAYPGKDPALKVWLETVDPAQYGSFKDSLLRELSDAQKDLDTEVKNSTYQGVDYVLTIRKDLSFEGLKGKNSIGGAHIFFPDRNAILTIQSFNTRHTLATESLPPTEPFVKQVIDSVRSSGN